MGDESLAPHLWAATRLYERRKSADRFMSHLRRHFFVLGSFCSFSFFFLVACLLFVFFLLNGCCCGSCGDAPTPRCGPSELTADTVDGDAGRRSKSTPTPTPTPPTPTQHMRSERRQPALVCFFSFRSTVCVCVCVRRLQWRRDAAVDVMNVNYSMRPSDPTHRPVRSAVSLPPSISETVALRLFAPLAASAVDTPPFEGPPPPPPPPPPRAPPLPSQARCVEGARESLPLRGPRRFRVRGNPAQPVVPIPVFWTSLVEGVTGV